MSNYWRDSRKAVARDLRSGRIKAYELQGVFGLVVERPPALEVIDAWTPAQKLEAWEWAFREHLAASDHPVRRRPRPAFFDQGDRAPESPHVFPEGLR